MGAYASGPSWSPDGRQIVFSRNDAQGDAGELYVANVDGSGERQLTTGGFINAVPSWSPDGTQIVFERTSAPPGGRNLWAISVDGSGFLCSSYVSFIVSCEGDVPFGASLDLSSPGTHTFTVRAVDFAGRTATKTVTYQVQGLVVDLRTPTDGATYTLDAEVTIDYSCAYANGPRLASCVGDQPNGALLDTTQAGTPTPSA